MESETTQFEVGQTVEYRSADKIWKPAKVLAIQEYEKFSIVTLNPDSGAPFNRRVDYGVRPIQYVPIPQPAAVIQYPPLRTMKNDHEPMQTWQQVLDSKSLAERQPHLYLLGEYDFVTAGVDELGEWLQNHPNSLILDFNPPLDPDDESDFGMYRVFIITEGG